MTGHKFRSEIHLKQPGFTYSACGKDSKRIQKFMQARNTNYIYWNVLNKACFEYDMA